MASTKSTHAGCSVAERSRTAHATTAIVRCRTWSARNSIPGHGLQALPTPVDVELTRRHEPAASGGLGLDIGPAGHPDLPAVDEHVGQGDDQEVGEAGPPEREHRRHAGTARHGTRAPRAPSRRAGPPCPCSARSSRSGGRSPPEGGRRRARRGPARCPCGSEPTLVRVPSRCHSADTFPRSPPAPESSAGGHPGIRSASASRSSRTCSGVVKSSSGCPGSWCSWSNPPSRTKTIG